MIEPTRILASYHYLRRGRDLGEVLDDVVGPVRPQFDLFLDSGAYTALTSGNPIDVHAYGAWMQRHGHHGAAIANLDVIGNDHASAEATWLNQRILEDEYGLRPLPVVHIGEPWSALDRYLEAGHDYIALGGLVGRAWTTAAGPWCVEAFRRIDGAAVVHGFGVTRSKALFDLPWYSVDSSSWTQPRRFALATVFDDKQRKVRLFWLNDAQGMTRNRDFIRICRSYGVRPEAIRNPRGKGQALAAELTALSSRRLEAFLRRRFGDIKRPSAPEQTGLRIYLVASTLDSIRDVDRAIQAHYTQGAHP